MKHYLILFQFLTISLFASVMTEDLGLYWGMKIDKLKIYISNQMMKNYPQYNSATPEEQDQIIKRIRKNINKIFKNRIFFKEKNPKYDNSIYAGEFHYNNNESMITFMTDKKTMRFFLIKNRLWKVVIVIDTETMGKKYDLKAFINHFKNKYKSDPYKIDYDKFKEEQKIPLKAYFKDDTTLMSLTYNDIYSSFIIVYSSIKVMKMLKKQGFKVIVRGDINLDVDVGDEVKEYDQLLYETDYTSDEDDELTKDVFEEIDNDFKKEEKLSKEKAKKRELEYKKQKSKRKTKKISPKKNQNK